MLCQRCEVRLPEEANYCMRCGASLRTERLGRDGAAPAFYHAGARRLQDEFETRRLADHLERSRLRPAFADDDRAFIDACAVFFLATADAEGRPECSYRGGLPGFVRVLDELTLAFPNYDGNGMFKRLGNILVNPHVGLVFMDFERQRRLRVNGVASVHQDDPLLASAPGADLIIRVRATQIFPNCPRYIHKMQLIEHSVFTSRENVEPPMAEWRKKDEFRDILPERDRVRLQRGP